MSEAEHSDRVTIRMPDQMIERIDAGVAEGEYMHRTAAIRDACREKFIERGEPVVATDGGER